MLLSFPKNKQLMYNLVNHGGEMFYIILGIVAVGFFIWLFSRAKVVPDDCGIVQCPVCGYTLSVDRDVLDDIHHCPECGEMMIKVEG